MIVNEKTGRVDFGARGIHEVTVRLVRSQCSAELSGAISDPTVIDNSSNWSVSISAAGREQNPKFGSKGEAVKFFDEQVAKLS